MVTLIAQILVVIALVVAVGTIQYALGGEYCARHGKHTLLLLAVGALVVAPSLLAKTARTQNVPVGFPDLVAALKATPGCIGVEPARTASGKQLIFAWFEDKKAVLTWYYSDTHQNAMKQFFPAVQPRTPMPDVPDDGGPVLVIASLTMADKSQSSVTSLPVSQIAIELYRPLPGGVALGGRFAPSALRVPGMRVIPVTQTDK